MFVLLCRYGKDKRILKNGNELPDWCPLDNELSIDEVHDIYNNSNEECMAQDPNRTTLEYGGYSIEEFIWWLKKHDYKFIK